VDVLCGTIDKMGHLRFATHPQVRISAEIPVPLWGLNDVGRSRARAFASQPWLARTTRLISSDETKALEAAAILAVETGLAIEVRHLLHENDRSSTGYVPPQRFEQLANAFFGEPLRSIEGWESAAAAQARVKAATADLMVDDDDDVLIVAHGAVGTLLLCDLLGVPISRVEDQVGEDAVPGGGNYWTFDRSTRTVIHRWRAFEATA
jgi:broad specificity phosphatase PhoE